MNINSFAMVLGYVLMFFVAAFLFIVVLQFMVNRVARLFDITFAVAYLFIHKKEFDEWLTERERAKLREDVKAAMVDNSPITAAEWQEANGAG